jgi:hypothetical protein
LDDLRQALFGCCVEPFGHDEPHFDLLQIVLNQLVLQDLRDLPELMQADQGPVALAVGQDDHVALSTQYAR